MSDVCSHKAAVRKSAIRARFSVKRGIPDKWKAFRAHIGPQKPYYSHKRECLQVFNLHVLLNRPRDGHG